VSAPYGGVLLIEGRLEEALDMMEHALEVLSGEEPDEATAMLAAQLGRAYFFHGRAEDGAARIEQALTIAETLRLPEVISEAMNTKALILQKYARREEATLLLQRALSIALESNLGEPALRAYNNLGAFLEMQDQFLPELDLTGDALEFARKQGSRLWEEAILWGNINPLVSVGCWDDALGAAKEVEDSGAATGYRGPETMFTSWIYLQRGETTEARALLEKYTESESEDVQTRAAWHAKNAPVSRAEKDLETALRSAMIAFDSRAALGPAAPMSKDGFVEALETLFEMNDLDRIQELIDVVRSWRPGEVMPYMRAQLERATGRLEIARGKDPSAGLGSARRAFDEISMPFWAAVVALELAEWLLSEGRNGEAAPLIEDARKTFEELRAKPWLERLDSCGALDTIAQAT
jgi:tetratricopeptide (TPR) repeat protein